MTTGQGTMRRGAATWLRTALLAPLLLACSEPATEAPTDPCAPVFWVRPAATAKQVELIGSWNDWTTPGIPLARAGTSGYAGARLPVPAGEHGYLVVEDGVPRIDEDNALTTFRGDTEVSLLDIPACGATSLVVVDRTVTSDGAVTPR